MRQQTPRGGPGGDRNGLCDQQKHRWEQRAFAQQPHHLATKQEDGRVLWRKIVQGDWNWLQGLVFNNSLVVNNYKRAE